MPPQCCGKNKKPELPGTTPEERQCLDEAWELFCSLCPACQNQACIDYMYGLYEYDYWACYTDQAIARGVAQAEVGNAPAAHGSLLLAAHYLATARRHLGRRTPCKCGEGAGT